MERREEEYEGESIFYLQGLDKAFTILHDAPALPASRQQKTKKDQKPTARDISRQKLLEHHAALYQGEPDEYRLLRADAMDSCWEQLSSRIQATLDGTDQQVFSSILHFVKDHHKSPLALANISQSGYHRVPTALVLAGGVNSADHSETFPQLVKFMKDKGLYVALLQPHSFGRTVGDALNEVLRQLSGLDTQAQHAEALIAWYYDECGGQIPITVVLGLTTAEAALHEMLSSEVTDRCMDCRSFKLASAMTRMNRLVSNVLLGGQGGWPGLVFDGSVISALVKKFYTHYYSTSVWKHGLQLVALEHFRTQPTSFLAASSLKQGPQDALRAACTKLPLSVAAEVKKAAGGKGGAKAADAFQDFLSSWYRWAVAVHWVVLAARCAGLPGSCWQYVHVLEDALDPKFDTTRTAKGFMDLERLLKKLLPEQVCHLAGEMQNVVRQVEGAEAVLAEEVQQLQAIAEEASPPANEQDARAEEEGGQPESSGNPAGAPESDSLPAPADAPGGRQQRSQQQEGGGFEEGKSAQQEKDAPPRAAASRKREVYHSKASRQKALLEKASQAAAASKGAAARELERKAQEAAAPGAKLAAWLLGVLRRVLGTPPTKLPGSAPFTCKAASAVHSLSGSFRQVVHAGLTQPHLFLSGIREQVGVDAQMEDACLAYMLFDQDPNCVNVADWFQAFCDVHLGGGQQEGERSPQVKKKTAVKGKRKLGGGQGGAAQVRGAEKAEKMRELAARFTQATSELQLIGLIKPAKRRRGDFVQRLVHMPAEAV